MQMYQRAWPGRWRRLAPLLLVLALGAGLRVAYLQELSGQPDFRHPGVDAGFHDYWARALVTGDWTLRGLEFDPEIRTSPYFRPPAYPWFLAFVYRLGGLSHWAPRIAQALLGLFNVLLVAWVARRHFGDRPALLTALALCSYNLLIYFEGELLEPVPLVTSLLLMVALLGRQLRGPDIAAAAAAGVAGGVAALFRPNALVWVPVAAAWLWWVSRGAPPKRRVAAAAALLAGAALAVLPVTARNLWVGHDRVLITSNLGINLYIGNHPDAKGSYFDPVIASQPFGTADEYPALVRRLEGREGRPLKASEASSLLAREAWGFVLADPARALRLMLAKTALFWGPIDTGHNKILFYEVAESRVLSRLPLSFPAILALGVVGWVWLLVEAQAAQGGARDASRDRGALAVLLAAFVLAYFASFLPFFITGQYRVAIVPLLLLPAGVAVDRILTLIRRARPAALGWLAASAALWWLASVNWTGYVPNRAHWHHARGTAYLVAQDDAAAEREFERAVAAQPRHAKSLYELARLASRRGDRARAERLYRDALRANPRFVMAHNNLANLLLRQGHANAAANQLRQALSVDPEDGLTHYNLGVLLLQQDDLVPAEAHLRKALALSPDRLEAYSNLAALLMKQNRHADAVPLLEEALARNPDFQPAIRNLRICLDALTDVSR